MQRTTFFELAVCRYHYISNAPNMYLKGNIALLDLNNRLVTQCWHCYFLGQLKLMYKRQNMLPTTGHTIIKTTRFHANLQLLFTRIKWFEFSHGSFSSIYIRTTHEENFGMNWGVRVQNSKKWLNSLNNAGEVKRIQTTGHSNEWQTARSNFLGIIFVRFLRVIFSFIWHRNS